MAQNRQGALSGSRPSDQAPAGLDASRFDPARMTEPQKVALARMLRLGSNPYGWSASDLLAAGRTMQWLWENGFVSGGNIYGWRTRTYILTERGRAVAIATETRSAETAKTGSVEDEGAGAGRNGIAQTPPETDHE